MLRSRLRYARWRFAVLCSLVAILLAASVLPPWDTVSGTSPIFADVGPGSSAISVDAISPVPYNSRFGLAWVSSAEMSTVPDSRYQLALNTGSRWNRWVMYWVDHEGSGRGIDWTTWDRNVIRDRAHGFNVLALLQQTPDWAVNSSGETDYDLLNRYQRPGSKVDQDLSSQDVIALDTRPPRNLDKPVFLSNGSINPENYWGYFVYRTVNRYKPNGDLAKQQGWTDGYGIRYWEMWNEPNLTQYWGGTVGDYYRLLKVGYQAAKSADPSAVVVWGGIAHAGNTRSWATSLMSSMVGDGSRTSGWPYFDVSNFHWYDEPGVLYSQSSDIQKELSNKGLGGKPMWITETNIRTFGDPGAPAHPSCGGYPKSASADEQASFAIQAFANAFSAGVERVFVHQFQDDQYGDYYREAWGLMRNDGSLKPLYTAYQVAAKYFANPKQASRYVEGSGKIVRVALKGVQIGGAYYTVTVLWNVSGGAVQAKVPASAGSAQRLRKDGSFLSPISPSGGNYTVTLDAARLKCPDDGQAFYVGGDPVILLEDTPNPDYTAPTASVQPLPAKSANTFTVAWSGSDDSGGSGIRSYDVQKRDATAGESWQDWQTNATNTSAVFQGTTGHTYEFRCRAIDNAGNQGEYPAGAQAQTTVADGTPPTASVAALPNVVDPSFTLSWSGSDGVGGSGIKDYDVQYRDTTAGTGWTDWRIDTTATSQTILGQPGHSYEFRCRATDNAGNSGAFPDSAQARTTVRYVPPTTGLVRNGGFEGSGTGVNQLNGWSVLGSTQPSATTLPHSGSYSVLLGSLTGQASGESTVYQRLQVPANAPGVRLSFWYLVSTGQSSAESWFDVRAQYVDDYGQTATVWIVPSETVWKGSGWQHVTVDLASVGNQGVDLRGKEIDLFFRSSLSSSGGSFLTYLDDVEVWPFELRLPLSGWSPYT
jgi:hypothetical protein